MITGTVVVVIIVGFTTTCAKVVSSNHYVIKFVSDLQQVGGFLRVS